MSHPPPMREAESVVERLVREAPDKPLASLAAAQFHAYRGESERALEAISPALLAAGEYGEMFSRELAHAYALAGETDRALKWLRNAVRLGHINYPFLAEHDRFLDRLRGDARFQELLRGVERRWREFELPEIVPARRADDGTPR